MRLALFQKNAQDDTRPGVIVDRGIVDVSDLVARRGTPQATMTHRTHAPERARSA